MMLPEMSHAMKQACMTWNQAVKLKLDAAQLPSADRCRTAK